MQTLPTAQATPALPVIVIVTYLYIHTYFRTYTSTPEYTPAQAHEEKKNKMIDPGIGASLVWTVLTILDQIQSSISGLSDARSTYGKWKSYSSDDGLEWWLGEELECLARSEAGKTSERTWNQTENPCDGVTNPAPGEMEVANKKEPEPEAYGAQVDENASLETAAEEHPGNLQN